MADLHTLVVLLSLLSFIFVENLVNSNWNLNSAFYFHLIYCYFKQMKLHFHSV